MPRYIDADALRKEFEREGELNPCDRLFWGKVLSVIDNAPTIESLDLYVYIGGRRCGKRQRLLDELRPKGKWEFVQYEANSNIGNWRCTNCRGIAIAQYNFCPNCGADMR